MRSKHTAAIMRHPLHGESTLVVTCLDCDWMVEADSLIDAGRLMDQHMGATDGKTVAGEEERQA
jgi:cellulose synthase/poly-beta-1,6-N-acetylglucosamine synthase-like glycosyltransferase